MIKICEQCNHEKNIDPKRKICYGCREFNRRLANGTVRPPDYALVNTRAYKDPMEKIKDGFGYYGAITQTNDGELIQCNICGFYYANVGAHVRIKHGVAPRDYRIKYGLRLKENLLSPATTKKFRDLFNAGHRYTKEQLQAMSRKGQAVLKAKGYKPGGDMWTAQTRNEKGMCKDQTLAKIHALAEKMDGQPNENSFYREYGWGQKNVIAHWFGSWPEAMKVAGYRTFRENSQINKEDRILTALEQISNFYTLHGRTPQFSDFKSNDLLPPPSSVSHWLGNLNNARHEAGVPVLVPKGRKWVERML